MFVDVFIQRPILASVCSLVLILAGLLAIPTMPVAQYPSLAPPQVTVAAFYTGANAQEVETASRNEPPTDPFAITGDLLDRLTSL